MTSVSQDTCKYMSKRIALLICDCVLHKFAYGHTQIVIYATSIANIMIKGFFFLDVMIN